MVDTLSGRVPGWALRGDGYGYGSGSGYGSGDGYGAGYGEGDAGYGEGDGYGCGAGYGSGEDLERCIPSGVTVTAAHLRANGACADEYRRFQKVFPDGARYPEDITKATENRFDLGWAREKLGLLPVLTEDAA